MDLVRELVIPASADDVFAHIDDLDAYPEWMTLISEVERLDDGDTPSWMVVLQAQVGPFTRSKRLRMVRAALDSGRRAVFERDEVDGRNHAMWRLDAQVEPHDDGSLLRMGLFYGGRLWGGPVLERALDAKVAESSERLLQLVTGQI